jgi:hypothetical protein
MRWAVFSPLRRGRAAGSLGALDGVDMGKVLEN